MLSFRKPFANNLVIKKCDVYRLWKRLTAPLKRTARALEAVEATVGNVTAGQAGALLTLEQCCADTKSFTSDADKLLRRVESAVIAITHRDDQLEARLKVQISFILHVQKSCIHYALFPSYCLRCYESISQNDFEILLHLNYISCLERKLYILIYHKILNLYEF